MVLVKRTSLKKIDSMQAATAAFGHIMTADLKIYEDDSLSSCNPKTFKKVAKIIIDSFTKKTCDFILLSTSDMVDMTHVFYIDGKEVGRIVEQLN